MHNTFELTKATLEENRKIGMDISKMDMRMEDVEIKSWVKVGDIEEIQKEMKRMKDSPITNFEGMRNFMV